MSAGEWKAVYRARVRVNWGWFSGARTAPSVCSSFVLLGSVFRVPALGACFAGSGAVAGRPGAIAGRSGAIIRRSGAIACGSEGVLFWSH